MKWEQNKQYTPQEIQSMQQNAIERVRQMQQRSEQAVRRSPKAPSLFIPQHSDPPKEPVAPPPLSSPTASPKPHPSSSFHPEPPEPSAPVNTAASFGQILEHLHLDSDRLILLALLFLLFSEHADPELLVALLYLLMQ